MAEHTPDDFNQTSFVYKKLTKISQVYILQAPWFNLALEIQFENKTAKNKITLGPNILLSL